MSKYWYAIIADKEDNDWGNGTFNRKEAIRMLTELNDGFEYYGDGKRTACIATINANYDDEGNPTTDGECIRIETEDDIF